MTTTRERILQKINPRLLKMTPKLSAGNGLFVNLESDDSLEEGAKGLLKRFWRNQDICEKNKRNASQSEIELTITKATYNEKNDICEILSERLKIPSSKNEEENLGDRPGKNLQELKMELQEKISAKWEEEYKKRIKKNKLIKKYKESKSWEKKCLDEDSAEEDFDPNDFSEDEKDNQESEDDGCEGDIEDEEVKNEEEVDNFLRDYDTSPNESYDETRAEESLLKNFSKGMEFEDMETCSLPPAYQPGGGLLYGGSELSQCDEDLPQNLLSPCLKLSVPESPQCKSLNDFTLNGNETITTEEFNNSFSVRNKLFSQKSSDCFDLTDAYEFCSGKFPDDSSNSQLRTEMSVTQESNCGSEGVPLINQDEEEVDKSEENDNCSEDEISDDSIKKGGEVHNKPENGSKVRKNIIIFDDSENEEESIQPEAEKYCERSKILSDDEEARDDKAKKKRKNLKFSDEEEDENGEDEKEETDSEKEEGIDSEEEEVNNEKEEEEEEDEKDEERSVHYDSEENEIINPREFFEKEAELSGSEWSVDEDERGLDEFDVEEGDADILDNDQVRSQLEKIHLRRVLDEDVREVRMIQEILFEDGDLYSDGKGRDRKFKWKNLGKTFEENEETGTKKEEGNSSEDEGGEEEQQRKLRHEKELFLMEKKKNGDESSDDEIIQDFQSIKVTSVKSSVKVLETGNSNVMLNHTLTGRHVMLSKPRGSFLTRNEEFLSSLAKVASGISDNVLGPKHSKNFIFATKSPEKTEPIKNTANKRQVDDAETRGSRRDKKFKILQPGVDTEPSIVDLLV